MVYNGNGEIANKDGTLNSCDLNIILIEWKLNALEKKLIIPEFLQQMVQKRAVHFKIGHCIILNYDTPQASV